VFSFSLTDYPDQGQNLNMSKLNTFKAGDKGEQTRQHLLDTALRLFRERGFDATTMRDIAEATDLSLGAAYYYFESKEAIIAAYYDFVQAEHLRLARAVFGRTDDLKRRISAAIHSKLHILANDRKLLAALFRYGGDPEHPLNWFGPQTRRQRDLSMMVFAEAVAKHKLPDDLKEAAPVLLWAMHMGLLLYLVYDGSQGQRQTRKLAEGGINLAMQALRMVKFPLLRPLRKQVHGLLTDAGLLPAISRPVEAMVRQMEAGHE
jgi:AcrR family transcriptional regulator